MRVMSPPVVAANGEDLHEIHVHVQNPHDFAVDKLCVKAHTGHAMRLHGDHTQCVSLAANEAATVCALCALSALHTTGGYEMCSFMYGFPSSLITYQTWVLDKRQARQTVVDQS